MSKRNYKNIEGFNQTLGRFTGKKHKAIVSNVIRNNDKVKKNNHISAYDPATRQFVSGSLTEVASALNVSPSTITKRFKKGSKMEMKDIKGFIIGKHKDNDSLFKYRQDIKKEDKIIEKAKPILGGDDYIELLKPNYELQLKEEAENKHFNTMESRFTLELSDTLTMEDIEKVFSEAIKKTTANLEGSDKIRVIIFSQNLQNPFSTPLLNKDDMNADIVMDLVGRVENYTEDFVLDESIEIVITTVKPDKKKKKKKYKGYINKNDIKDASIIADTHYEESAPSAHKINTTMKSSIIQIKNKDSLCVPRAIATGYYLSMSKVLDNESAFKDYDNCKRGRKIQETKALELVAEYESLTEKKYDGEGFTLEDLETFEFITGLSITAIDGDNSLNIVYPDLEKGEKYKPPENDLESIYLYLHTGAGRVPHCDLINNERVAGFFGRHYFCHKCKKCYEKKDCHKCKFNCKMCCKASCPTITADKGKMKYNIQCLDCNRFFPNNTCYDNHLLKSENKNGKMSKSVCERIWKCQECKKVMTRDLQPPETHICGDYQCKNCKKIVRKDHKCYMLPRNLNEPSDKYIFFDFESDIEVNAVKKEHEVMFAISMYFHSPEPIRHNNINEWCEWAFDNNHKEHTFIAHNGMGYDYRFIIRWIYANTQYEPFVIWGGQKIIYLSIKELNIRFIDSLSFLTMPLSAFPKTFGEKELKKGFFPHWFNTAENRNYVGKVPDISYFKPERMNVKSNKEFMKWYEERSKYEWDEAKEMEEYCISDVDILRKCCKKFRELYLDVAGIDPFTYLTIASVCMAIYKYYYVDETYPARTQKIMKVKKSLGNVSKLKGKQLEIWNDIKSQYEQQTLDNIFSEKKIAIFKYEEVEWMRKAFFGGRTNATKLLYTFPEGEEGIYSDITSLYPTVNYYDIYPKGHPIIIGEEDIEEEHYKKLLSREYLGFFDIEVIPPKRLYHPVLPTKGEKLIFDLNEKRGLWCSNEVYVALDMGYKIKKIYEIRYFEEGTKSLFKGYVGKFLKLKQEASDYPKWVSDPTNPANDCPEGYTREEMLSITEEDRKDLYIHLYEEGQGILLDKTKIIKNEGLRAIAKLCLNSLWGKFGQRTNMGRCEIVSDKEKFFDIITDDRYENINWIDIAEDKIQLSYTFKDEYVENDYNTNMAIACFTTSRARMRLYEEALKPLDRQVLYFDTDSVVYTYNPNNPNHIKLANGDLLGEWTDELEGDKMVGTFVSGGPKNYSYELLTPEGESKCKVKVKGFTLNKETSGLINHHSMKELIEDTLFSGNYEDNKIEADWHGIKRVANNGLENISMKKKYGLCYTKRRILPPDENNNYDTRPFGWEYDENGL
jgi:hypothetical protein